MSSLSVTSPAQLVASIAYLIGFEPSHSVVGVFMRDCRIVLTVRIDADGDVTEGLQRAAIVGEATEMAVLLFDTDIDVTVPHDVVVRDVISVVAGRWRSRNCVDPSCCPEHGNEISQDVRDRVAAAFVADGVVPLADRSTMEQLFVHAPDDAFADVIELAADDAVVILGLDGGAAALRRWREDSADDICASLTQCPSDVYAQARAVVGLQDIRIRDVVLHRLADTPDLRVIAEWLRNIAVHCPHQYAPAMYTVCAAAYWQGGDGAKACVALEIALGMDADYSLASLLFRAIQAGMPPATWRRALRETSEEECFTGAA